MGDALCRFLGYSRTRTVPKSAPGLLLACCPHQRRDSPAVRGPPCEAVSRIGVIACTLAATPALCTACSLPPVSSPVPLVSSRRSGRAVVFNRRFIARFFRSWTPRSASARMLAYWYVRALSVPAFSSAWGISEQSPLKLRLASALLPHLHRDCGLTPPTSAPGLRAHSCHICTGTANVVQCFDITRKVTYANMQKWYKSGFTCPPAPVRPSLRRDYRDYRLLRRDYRATAYCVGITGITGTRVVSHARRRRSAHHCVGLAWRAPREPRPLTHAQTCTGCCGLDSTSVLGRFDRHSFESYRSTARASQSS
jgi:hypothetical protein